MKADANIFETSRLLDDGRIAHSYSWHGGRVAILNFIWIIQHKIKSRAGYAFCLGKLRLRVIYVDWNGPGEVYVSLDGWKSRVWAIFYPVVNGIGWVLHRFTLTAWIWGLTRFVVPGRIITWRDVYPWPWIERGWGWLSSEISVAWKTIVAKLTRYRHGRD